jgi:phosphoglycolate phosphatase
MSECNIVVRTLLLDLDGTLVNSVPDLAGALNRLMVSRRLAPFTEAEVALMVGDGVAKLIERAFAGRSRVPDDTAIADYSADYAEHAAVATRPYPGVAETLHALTGDGWKLAVCTNKPEAAARILLGALGLAPLFAAIGGGDSFPVRKPDPAHLLATLRAAGGVPELAVMSGDHANDVAAAQGAGVKCIFAAWGYGPPAMANGADAVAQDFPHMAAIARQLLQAAG